MLRIGIECEQLEGKRFGVGHTLAQLLEALTRVSDDIEKRYKFVLYFKASVPEDAFLKYAVFEKKVLTGGLVPRSFNIFYHIMLPIAYRRDRLDAVFLPSYMMPAFLFFGRAVALLTNDVYWEAHHGNLPFRYRLSYRLFCWWAARRARKIVTISDVSREDLQRYYNIPDARIAVNPWGLDRSFRVLPRTPEYETKVAGIKKELGITGKFFLSMGQAFPRRHVRETVKAFASIAENYHDVQYLAACVDKYNPPVLDKLTANNRSFIRVNYVKREYVPYLLNEALALVYVSDKEALGLPPLEALACGRPAIVKDSDISRELFGETGYFVKNSGDPKDIAAQMRRLLERPEETPAILKEQSKHLARFNWDEHVRRFLNILDEVAGK